jgi:hypothetical protein
MIELPLKMAPIAANFCSPPVSTRLLRWLYKIALFKAVSHSYSSWHPQKTLGYGKNKIINIGRRPRLLVSGDIFLLAIQ